MYEGRNPKIVVTIHGIRTHGQWQKRITPHLARHGLIPYHIDYGFFFALFFFIPWTRNRQVQKVREELRDLVQRTGARRLSIVAHSFGTLIAMEAMAADNGGLKYDRVVLSGSIVPVDFDWKRVIQQDKWVLAARNERATKDSVVRVADFASKQLHWISRLNAGSSGFQPFSQTVPELLEFSLKGHHSEVHIAPKFEAWARFIAFPCLPPDILRKVRTQLQSLRQEAAALLGLDSADRLRTNLFAPIDGGLRIVPGAVDNMNYAPEYELCIDPEDGATGCAFVAGRPCLVKRDGAHWTGNHLPGPELDKLEPTLKWVIALPIRDSSKEKVFGVVNIDGLDNIPSLLQNKGAVEAVVALWLGTEGRFRILLNAAFRGGDLEIAEI